SPPTKRAATSTTAPSRKASTPQPQKGVPRPPDVPGDARIIAIANQKGGVGKSTTTVSLGATLADLGYRVLVVDLDPQGNASTGLGIRHEARDITVYDVIVAEAPLDQAIVHTPVARLHAIPSTIDLAGAEIELVSQFSREARLKKAIQPVRSGVYDFIIFDCPPSLGLLTVNALTAAEELIVPIQCEYYALEGLGQLLRNVSLVQQNINPGLRLSGIVMTMFDPRTKLSEQVVEEVQRYFGDLVYDVIIPRTVRLSEAPGFGQPITVYDPKSKGAECYRQLAREVALRPPPDEPMPVFDDLPTVTVAPVADTVILEPLDESEPEVPTVRELIEEVDPPATQAPVSPTVQAPEPPPDAEPVLAPWPAAQPEPEAPDESISGGSQAISIKPEDEAQIWLGQLAADAESETTAATTEEILAEAAREAEVQMDEDEMWDEAEAPAPRVQPPSSPAPPGHLPERRVVVIDDDADIDIRAGQEAPPQIGTEPDQPAMANIGATLEENGGRKRRWRRLFGKGGE
ncbi:MAG: chromosome partitioning protein, partial [Actinomycetota bacterium]|nr:chromosome partitioning protein [Actinomycetota bacterium]